MINIEAITPVALVKKLPADLEETKLSCDAPIPRAPPSDFCNKIIITNK